MFVTIASAGCYSSYVEPTQGPTAQITVVPAVADELLDARLIFDVFGGARECTNPQLLTGGAIGRGEKRTFRVKTDPEPSFLTIDARGRCPAMVFSLPNLSSGQSVVVEFNEKVSGDRVICDVHAHDPYSRPLPLRGLVYRQAATAGSPHCEPH